VIPLDFAYGIGSGLIIAAVLYLVLRWTAARESSEGDWPPPGALRPSFAHLEDPLGLDGTALAPASPDVPPTTVETLPPSPAVDPPPYRPIAPTAVRSSRPRDEGPGPPRSAPAPETLRLSQRVILHVYAQGILPPGEVAPLALCQAGFVEALGIPQAGLAAVLRRLEAAGVLVTERGHVRGRDRRLKIYRLTPRGVDVARELRTRSHRRSGR
jgi:DNA-binding MarR family transcriptional regulator